MSGQNPSLPRHVAIIMDGNGRWAQKRGLPRNAGHEAGADAVRAIITRCRELGIGHLTLYSFSKENWGRPKDEVRLLFGLLVRFLGSELKLLLDNSIRLSVFGEISELPFAARTALQQVISKTAKCDKMRLNLALNYSGREEVLRAARQMMTDGLTPGQVSEEALSARLYSAGQPDPDLLIRTSGEHRISGFLLFQAAYSEFYFTSTYWPDFDAAELDKALAEYAKRQRRFGLTGEQVEE